MTCLKKEGVDQYKRCGFCSALLCSKIFEGYNVHKARHKEHNVFASMYLC